jgi:hypothetical protein
VIGAAEILTELQRRGVSVAAEGDTLCLKPRRSLDDGLLARIREAKPAILEALRSKENTPCDSPRCAGCYEVEPGVRIHPPKCGESHGEWLNCLWTVSNYRNPGSLSEMGSGAARIMQN